MKKMTKLGVAVLLTALVCALVTTTALADTSDGAEAEPNSTSYYNVETGGPPDSYVAEDGHAIVTTDIVEVYNEKFEIYEQTFYTKYFYTNIANGSITEGSVYIDIPAGISVTMEKDGIPDTYVNKKNIYKWGSYNLELRYFADNGNEYLGRFRFRIHPLPVKEAADVEDVLASSSISDPPIIIGDEQTDTLDLTSSLPVSSSSVAEEPAPIAPDTTEPVPEDTVPDIDRRVKFVLPEVTNGIAKGSKVTIKYTNPQYIDHVMLYRDDLLMEGFEGTEIKENGHYRLEVYDVEGSSATAEFVIDYKMNTAAILSIMLLVLLLVAGGIFILRTRKEVKVS